MSISKCMIACCLSLGLGAMALTLPAGAAVETATKKAAPQKKTKAGKAKVTKAAPEAAPVQQEDEPDTTGSTSTDFNCELGNKITIYSNEQDDSHIALRWKKRLHRLTRVGTSTGAQRFENPLYGLIWIGIPAKGMLLDSKLNRQLANECKNAEQIKPLAVEVAAGAAPG